MAAEDLSQYVNVNIYFYKPSYSLLKKRKKKKKSFLF